ncbi:SH3 domain-binding protein 5-like [Lytechinus variegatus]|uniref:SH3 domain-binding protein 5-like n=1 Tax=Lytechinus variegatus TaxID=7654 RepID=UPI001BB2BCCD|nr:SH3 domain-binding protein 5-like [Lytechinus variegatus]
MAELCEEEIDPRIKEELERLNSSTDQINSLELQLDEVRATFRQALTESTQSLNAISKKIGSAIEKARPYYEARQKAKELQLETQKAALRFERACGMLTAAKEMVDLAEQGLFQDGRTFDANWQEMLNHATMKVGEAENERTLSVHEHLSTAANFNEAEREVKRLQKSLRSNINKSRPYFEMKASFNQNLERHKRRVSELEKDVSSAKKVYSNALRKLEQISDQIHEQRRTSASKLGQRESGVGAEASPIIRDNPSSFSPGHNRNLSVEVKKIDLVIKQHRDSASPSQRSKDDMDLSPSKVYPLPQRPLSYSEDNRAPDPHSILASFESTEHLDNISDTVSCMSEPMLDIDNEEEFDSGLDTLASRTTASLVFTGTEGPFEDKDSEKIRSESTSKEHQEAPDRLARDVSDQATVQGSSAEDTALVLGRSDNEGTTDITEDGSDNLTPRQHPGDDTGDTDEGCAADEPDVECPTGDHERTHPAGQDNFAEAINTKSADIQESVSSNPQDPDNVDAEDQTQSQCDDQLFVEEEETDGTVVEEEETFV